MCSAYNLNKQGDNIQPWCTPFPIWNQSVPCPVLTVASFAQISCFHSHTCPVLGPSSICICNFFLIWIPPHRPVGVLATHIMGQQPTHPRPRFLYLCCCQGGFLDLRKFLHVISLLQQSSAFATSFVLGISEGKQSFNCTPTDKHQLSSPGVHLFPTSILTNIFLYDCFWLHPQPRSPLHSFRQDV